MYDPTVNLGIPLKVRGCELLTRDGLRLGVLRDESTALAVATLANANAPDVRDRVDVYYRGMQTTLDAVKARAAARR